jgi:hypothetical protein
MNASDCQQFTVSSSSSRLNGFDRIKLLVRRLNSAFVRRLKKVQTRSSMKSRSRDAQITTGIAGSSQVDGLLKPGDEVYILPMSEIRKMLDDKRRTEGLAFMDGMEKYCDMKAKVYKKVNYLYDESKRKMVKCKNMVILEGLICDGKMTYAEEGCDKSCFFFWKESWLKKL